jgi:WD40 repeat protein
MSTKYPIQYLLISLLLFAFFSANVKVRAQSPTPTPSNRGLGIQSTSPSSSDQTNQQLREQKPELVMQTGYSNFFGPTRYVFSPDGRLLATAAFRSSTIKLWDTSNGRELRDLSSGGQSSPSFSPVIAFSRDSRMVAAGTGSNSVKVWDVVSGRELQTLEGQQTSIASALGIYFIEFTADGRIVTISDSVRVWDAASGRELHSFNIDPTNAGIASGGTGFAVSPDGRQLVGLFSGPKAELRFLDLTSGREVRSISLEDVNVAEMSFAANGSLFVSGIVDKRLKLWAVTTKADGKDLGPTLKDYSQIRISRDGRLLALSEQYIVKIFDISTGRELTQLKVPNTVAYSSQGDAFIGFSHDGNKLATGGYAAPTILWETTSGKQLVRLNGRTNMPYSVKFSADGQQLTSGGRTRWDLRTGLGLRISSGLPEDMFGWPSPDGRLIALMKPDSSVVTVLETPSGRQLYTFAPPGSLGTVQRIRFSKDSAKAFVIHGAIYDQASTNSTAGSHMAGSQVKIWDLKSGTELRTLANNQMPWDAVPSDDGRTIGILGSMGEISLWDIESGSKLRELSSNPMSGIVNMTGGMPMPMPSTRSKGSMPAMPAMPNMNDLSAMITNMMGSFSAGTMGRTVTSITFSSDGRLLASAGFESKSNFDLAAMMSGAMGQGPKGQNKKNSTDPQEIMKSMKVEAIGRIILWDASNGREVATLRGHGKGISQVAFSRDGKLLASASTDNTIRIWDLTTQRELRTLVAHTAAIESMDFSPDGRLLASASDDGGTFLWDTNTGEHLLTLVSLDDGGEWMVVTPQGLFDGTPPSWNQILWRYNGDTFNVAPIEWFFNEFYYPGLLSDIFAGKRPRIAQDVSKKDRRQPVVKLSLVGDQPAAEGISQRMVKVKLEITDAPPDKDNSGGSGARDIRLFRNGSLVKVWRGDVLKGQNSVTLEQDITVTAGPNRLVAYGFNKDNVKSKDAPLELKGADSLKRKGTAYIIAVGVNEYVNSQYNLKYAVADAQSFADEVRARQNQVGLFERVEVIPLLNENATKANILNAVKRLTGAPGPPTLKVTGPETIKRVEPEDTVMIYFAGHGTAQSQRFYLLPHDLGYSGDRTNLSQKGLQEILSHSISDLELEEALEGLDAGHLLLIIDACNSGQALEAEEKRRGPMNSKGLAQLAYEKGMYILTAAQSYQAALEVAQLGHGLLTYALIEEGLKTPSADTQPKDGLLIAREWLDFATDRVPLMQQEKMNQARGVGLQVAFTEGEKEIADPAKRSVQRPRVFYRRELEANPLVIAKP